VESILAELEKFTIIRGVEISSDLFDKVSPKVLAAMKRRVAIEETNEIRQPPLAVRMTLLAVFCFVRGREITDTLVDLLNAVVHKISARAETKVEQGASCHANSACTTRPPRVLVTEDKA